MDGVKRLLVRARGWPLLPGSLFGRLAWLLAATVLASHALALTLMFELRPAPPGPSAHPPIAAPGVAAPAAGHPRPPGPPGFGHPGRWHAGFVLDVAVRVAALLGAAWIGARWLSEPMDRLARAARELGAGGQATPVPESGPDECREAARVFNHMQRQIRNQLDERNRFVAAVSHDLRTPLTRLRLRAEGLADAEQRRRFSRDIADMDAMVRSTLDYLVGTAAPEAWAPVDVAALLQSLADDEAELGHAVPVLGHAAPLRAQPMALRRAVANLVENALRYGGSAEITMVDAPDVLRIEVRDHGPGLPPAELARVLEPFYRAEASRHRDHGGVGLGLSIARDIARRHGGQLVLANAPLGGLRATLQLPRRVRAGVTRTV